MDCTTEGIILKKIPHTDNSSVVHIYTREFGLLSFLVQGKNLTQKKAAYFQIGNLVDLSFNKKESGLQRIKEIGLTKGASILIDFHITQLIQFFSELVVSSQAASHYWIISRVVPPPGAASSVCRYCIRTGAAWSTVWLPGLR